MVSKEQLRGRRYMYERMWPQVILLATYAVNCILRSADAHILVHWLSGVSHPSDELTECTCYPGKRGIKSMYVKCSLLAHRFCRLVPVHIIQKLLYKVELVVMAFTRN